MLARMVARTVFLMRIRRGKKGDVNKGKGEGVLMTRREVGGGLAGCVWGVLFK